MGLNMTELIREIYERGAVTGRSGQSHKLHSAIDPEEGNFLFEIIDNDPKIHKTLEIGCAFGLSSLHICLAIRKRAGASHTIIDPFQNTHWDGVAAKYLEQAGIGFFELIEQKSEFALPQLLYKDEGPFDFIFIDGWHTFDHTLLDCFYATRLLRIGGYLAIDDVGWPSVSRVVSFLKTYPCFEEYGSISDKMEKSWKKTIASTVMSPISCKHWAQLLHPSLYRSLFEDRSIRMIALRKVAEDSRNWDWHVDRF